MYVMKISSSPDMWSYGPKLLCECHVRRSKAKIKVSLLAEYQGLRSNGLDMKALTDRQMDTTK